MWIEGALNYGENVNKTVKFMKRSVEAIVKVFNDWSIRPQIWSQRASCGYHQMVDALVERRIFRHAKSSRMVTVQQTVAYLNQRSSQMIAEHAVSHTMHRIGMNDDCCLQLTSYNASNSFRNTKSGLWLNGN